MAHGAGAKTIVLAALDNAWEREHWHPPLRAAADGMTAAEAAWQVRPGALTAWQFVRHSAFWTEVAVRRLAGEPPLAAEDDNDATFGPAGDGADEAGWRAAVERLVTVHAALRERVLALREEAFADPETVALLLGVAGHDAYHGAEIVQLRKLQGAWPEGR
jgi:hypothetical protein